MDRRTALQSLASVGTLALAGCSTGSTDTSHLDRYTEVTDSDRDRPPAQTTETTDRETETETPEPTPHTDFVDYDVYENDEGRVAVDVVVENQGSEAEDVTVAVTLSSGETTRELAETFALAPGDRGEHTFEFDAVYEELDEMSIGFDVAYATDGA